MRRQPLILYGASGHGKVVLDIARQAPGWKVAGWIDDDPSRQGQDFCGLPILGSAAALPRLYEDGIRHAVVVIGDNAARLAKAAVVEEAGFAFATLIHPRSTVADTAVVGAGTVVMAGAIVHADTVVGKHVIVNTAASIDHDGQIGDGVHIAPGVHLAGHVTVGAGTLLGIGSCVIPGRTIGPHAVVGAGSVVVSDLPGASTCMGVPARPVKAKATV